MRRGVCLASRQSLPAAPKSYKKPANNDDDNGKKTSSRREREARKADECQSRSSQTRLRQHIFAFVPSATQLHTLTHQRPRIAGDFPHPPTYTQAKRSLEVAIFGVHTCSAVDRCPSLLIRASIIEKAQSCRRVALAFALYTLSFVVGKQLLLLFVLLRREF